MVTVEVRVFATLRQCLDPTLTDDPSEPFNVQLPSGSTLKTLLERLCLNLEDPLIPLVNGLREPFAYPLSDGDRVGVFPPVGGG